MRTPEEIRATARPGRAFSNMTAFEIWAANRGCWDDCIHDDEATEKWCPIYTLALGGEWIPAEWPPAEPYGVGECTEYERRPDPGDGPDPEPEPDPVPDGQLDLFTYRLDEDVNHYLSSVDREVATR